jgi:hypothetical protein
VTNSTLRRASEDSGQPLDSSEMEVLDEIITSKHKTSGACPIHHPGGRTRLSPHAPCLPRCVACLCGVAVAKSTPIIDVATFMLRRVRAAKLKHSVAKLQGYVKLSMALQQHRREVASTL